MGDPTLLDLRSVRLRHRNGTYLLDGVTLSMKQGEILGVVGESGSGKSLTGLSIMGLQPPGELTGTLHFDGENLLAFGEKNWRKFRGKRAAMIFQDPMTAFLPVRRIESQITEQLYLHTSLSRRQAIRRVHTLLGQMGVPSPERMARCYPHELSGGMRQRAMIAMALSCHPELLVADEPTTALDVTVQAQILLLLRQIGAREASVMLITHDMGVVAQICTHVAVLYAGMVVESGPAEDLLKTPRHPYTQALLAAIPPLDGPKPKRLASIDGMPPTPGARDPGCVFSPRCAYRRAACAQRPALRPCGTQQVACVLYP